MTRHPRGPGALLAIAALTFCAALTAWRIHDRETAGSTTSALAGVRVPWPADGQAAIAVSGQGTVGGAPSADPVPIASLAKVMTAYVVLHDAPLSGGGRGFTVTVGDGDVADAHERAANDQSGVAVEAGEVLDERQLLEALLVPSANNIAVLLAVHESGSVGGFLDLMNHTAAELGMSHTRYTDPSGYDPGTVSTAADQLRLARRAMQIAAFRAIVRLPSVTLPVAGTVTNTNPLLGHDGFVGVKTGSDDAAGGCLAFASVRTVGGHKVMIIGVVLGQRGDHLLAAAGAAARPMVAALTQALRARAVSQR